MKINNQKPKAKTLKRAEGEIHKEPKATKITQEPKAKTQKRAEGDINNPRAEGENPKKSRRRQK
ncbi:MAG: hypothetical protein JNL49_09755 [Bacteroidia bacterium]|nr:hypothetical protein [Bacteroidia bacterium]